MGAHLGNARCDLRPCGGRLWRGACRHGPGRPVVSRRTWTRRAVAHRRRRETDTRFAAAPKPGARVAAFATANPGRVMAPGAGDQASSTYFSSVRDSKSVATWGLIRWEGAGQIALYTRSGNTDKPDDSWSDWAGPYSRHEGESVKSPAARFVQWRAVLTRGAGAVSPALTSVTLAYLPRNTRPAVVSVTIHPPGVVFQRPFSSEDGAIAGLDDAVADARRPPGDLGPNPPPPGRRMFQKGLQTIAWKAEDVDGNRMTYTLRTRAKAIRPGATSGPGCRTPSSSGTRARSPTGDTSSVSPPRTVRPTRRDGALTGEKVSDPVEVDNTPPVITVELVRQGGPRGWWSGSRMSEFDSEAETARRRAVAARLPSRRPRRFPRRALRNPARERSRRFTHRRPCDGHLAERDGFGGEVGRLACFSLGVGAHPTARAGHLALRAPGRVSSIPSWR